MKGNPLENLDWYEFALGYLMQAHYDVVKATLTINIDAPRAIDHPRHQEAKCFEETFANINLIFKEVRFFKNIVGTNMTSDPNEDAGDTEYIVCAPASEKLLGTLGFEDSRIRMDYGDGTDASVFRKEEPLMYAKLATEEAIFYVIFGELNVVEL